MNKKELQKILDQHKLWLSSKSNKGKRANLQGADLQTANCKFADLQNANLQAANLQAANLQNANLYSANLRDAGLRNADLQTADLRSADLRHADLQGANLTGVILKDAWISDKGKPNVPFLLGNVLITEVYQPGGYWWRVKTWTELKPNEMEMAELLYG